MKKFKYKLEPLLKIRRFQEKKEYSNYAKILGEINKHHEVINEARENKNRMVQHERAQMITGEFNLVQKKLAQEYYAKLATVQKSAQSKIEDMRDESEKLRQLAEKARKNRRVLEILKEKKLAVFQAELVKYEFKELDEFNSRRKG